jgi:hypothetical protein
MAMHGFPLSKMKPLWFVVPFYICMLSETNLKMAGPITWRRACMVFNPYKKALSNVESASSIIYISHRPVSVIVPCIS